MIRQFILYNLHVLYQKLKNITLQKKKILNMTTTSSRSKTFNQSLSNNSMKQNLFHKIEQLQSCLETIHSDLYRLEEEAKNVHDEKVNVENYLDQRAQDTKSRLMHELRAFENEVKGLIDRSKRETNKIDQKISSLKNSQLETMQMILALQRRIREVQVQLGSS